MARFNHIRDIVEYHLRDKSEEFAAWAFGPSLEKFLGMDFMEGWNVLHGHKLKLEPNGDPNEDIKKMIEIWKEEHP